MSNHPAFFYLKLVTPQQFALGQCNGEPVYLDCADCGAQEPIIGGMLVDRAYQIALVSLENGPSKPAVYCQLCFDIRWQQNEQQLLPTETRAHIQVTGATLLGVDLSGGTHAPT
ncbi:MAG: hypothetical protein BroJett011_42760 [Chloroflexota bacterium]|nr:MAG: hypothetical protein BroJett011_42760 [Chloroflexota bacterium]